MSIWNVIASWCQNILWIIKIHSMRWLFYWAILANATRGKLEQERKWIESVRVIHQRWTECMKSSELICRINDFALNPWSNIDSVNIKSNFCEMRTFGQVTMNNQRSSQRWWWINLNSWDKVLWTLHEMKPIQGERLSIAFVQDLRIGWGFIPKPTIRHVFCSLWNRNRNRNRNRWAEDWDCD
jgi:hypothetical protein